MRISDLSSDVCSSDLSDISTYGQAMQDPLAFEAVAARDVHMQVRMEERLMDVSAPIRIGDQSNGGVRIGYSLESVMRSEERREGKEGVRPCRYRVWSYH